LKIYGQEVEILNLRGSEVYEEGSRNPVSTQLGNPIEDAYRRDLTINTLFYNINNGEIEDFTGNGFKDLSTMTLRTPLDPIKTIKAEDIYVGETKHIVLKMKLAKPNGKVHRPFTVADVAVKYDDAKTGKVVKVELKPKTQFVKADEADKETILQVAEQAALLEASRAQVKAVAAANVGDFVAAQEIMIGSVEALSYCSARGSGTAASFLSGHEEQAQWLQADNYNVSYGNAIRASAVNTMKYRGATGQSADLYGTQSQKEMEDKFKVEDVVQPPPKIVENKTKKKGFSKKRSKQ